MKPQMIHENNYGELDSGTGKRTELTDDTSFNLTLSFLEYRFQGVLGRV